MQTMSTLFIQRGFFPLTPGKPVNKEMKHTCTHTHTRQEGLRGDTGRGKALSVPWSLDTIETLSPRKHKEPADLCLK